MIIEKHHQVGAGARLDARSDARLKIITVNCLITNLHAERFFCIGDDALPKQLITGGYKIIPAQPMQVSALSERRCLMRCKNPRHTCRASHFQKMATFVLLIHPYLSLGLPTHHLYES